MQNGTYRKKKTEWMAPEKPVGTVKQNKTALNKCHPPSAFIHTRKKLNQ